jgi:O-antigen/teichoic acid export membrane protein
LRFSLGLGLAASAGMGLIVFTPLASLWFERLAGLSSELAGVALPAARLLALLPALSVALSLERAMLVHARRTTAITRATLVEVLGTVVVLVVLIGASGIVGATAAALALLLGRIAGNLWMLPACRRWHRELADPGASHRVG